MLKIAYHPCYELPLKKGHRFPMEKYDLIPKQLLHEGTCDFDNFFKPTKIDVDLLKSTHTPDYIHRFINLKLTAKEIRKSGFPLSQQLVDRELIIAQGTITATKYAKKYGIAMNVAGGTHHAYSCQPEAFCFLNDQAIATNYLLDHSLANKILIIDLDVHQGDGTAEIFKNNSKVFTFSMHGAKNFPFRKQQSDLDIALDTGVKDDVYLGKLISILPNLLDEVKPDFVFYQCGVDILETDKLGLLSCSLEGCEKRDLFVLTTLFNKNIPVVCSMGGGYSEDIRIIIEAHCNTFRIAKDLLV